MKFLKSPFWMDKNKKVSEEIKSILSDLIDQSFRYDVVSAHTCIITEIYLPKEFNKNWIAEVDSKINQISSLYESEYKLYAVKLILKSGVDITGKSLDEVLKNEIKYSSIYRVEFYLFNKNI